MKTGNTHPSGFATPAENETAVNAAEGKALLANGKDE